MLTINLIRHDAGADWQEKCGGDGAFRLLLMAYGKCLYRIDGKKLILEKGDLLLIPASLSFYGQSIPTVFHEKYCVAFQTEALVSQLPLLSKGRPVKWKTGMFELLLDRFKLMDAQWEETLSYYRVFCQAMLLEVLAHASRELDKGTLPPVKLTLVDKMRTYIKEHYRDKVTKEQLGDHIGRSPNHAATLFREMTGQTIGEYVHRQRIKTAEYMLAESDLTIAEISEYLGYCDPSYFHKTFKRISGRRPAECGKERNR